MGTITISQRALNLHAPKKEPQNYEKLLSISSVRLEAKEIVCEEEVEALAVFLWELKSCRITSSSLDTEQSRPWRREETSNRWT